ncbi:MAG: F0F1-type ATP synthase membrane subunit b/b' [Lysobacterales bacterium]|jgi:F0F1-type ATP synthase membrane subunit b/b'
MDYTTLIVSFVVLMIIFISFSAFILNRVFVSNTDGAIQRLDQEYASATKKQSDLNKRLRQADEELTKKRAEAKQLSDKMRTDAEEETKIERDKIITKAREESEEIIVKAKKATETLRIEMEKKADTKFIQYSMSILNEILGEHAKDAFNKVLVDEYLEKLKDIDMGNINSSVKELEIVSATAISEDTKKQISSVVDKKIGRSITVKGVVDKGIGGGIILRFGSMALDGSLNGLIREQGTQLQQQVDDRR